LYIVVGDKTLVFGSETEKNIFINLYMKIEIRKSLRNEVSVLHEFILGNFCQAAKDQLPDKHTNKEKHFKLILKQEFL
jgi:hypothetical protein